MRRGLRNLALCLTVLALASCDLVSRKSPEAVFKAVAPSVYVVTISNVLRPMRLGSAVAIAPDLLVTNKHVVGGELHWVFEVSQGSRTWRAFPTYFDPNEDLCLLRVPGLNSQAVPLRGAPRVRVGEHVLAVGSPKGLELSLSEGLVSGIRQATESSKPMYQTTAPIAPGSSGGGLFDLRGRLVGITTSLLVDAQNIGFAVGADEVRVALAKVDLDSSKALGQASILLAAGRGEEAQSALETAVRNEPKLAVAWLALGHRHTLDDDREKCLRQAIEADPTLKDAWSMLADFYYVRVIEMFNDKADARSAQATETAATQEAIYRSKELEARKKAFQLDPTDREVELALAGNYRDSDLPDAAEALAKQVLASDPANPEAWCILGDVYEKRRQHDLAFDAYRKVLNQPALTALDIDRQALAWIGLAQIATARSDQDGARVCYHERARLNSESDRRRKDESAAIGKNWAERHKQAEAALALLQTPPKTQ